LFHLAFVCFPTHLFSPPLGLANLKVHIVHVYASLTPNERMFIQRFGHTAGLGR
jgi:hypothetical protein